MRTSSQKNPFTFESEYHEDTWSRALILAANLNYHVYSLAFDEAGFALSSQKIPHMIQLL